jgi:hypothetical protein
MLIEVDQAGTLASCLPSCILVVLDGRRNAAALRVVLAAGKHQDLSENAAVLHVALVVLPCAGLSTLRLFSNLPFEAKVHS